MAGIKNLNMGVDLLGEVSRTVMVQLRSQLGKPLPNPKQDEHLDDSASAKPLFWTG